jgi:hypothetical protein
MFFIALILSAASVFAWRKGGRMRVASGVTASLGAVALWFVLAWTLILFAALGAVVFFSLRQTRLAHHAALAAARSPFPKLAFWLSKSLPGLQRLEIRVLAACNEAAVIWIRGERRLPDTVIVRLSSPDYDFIAPIASTLAREISGLLEVEALRVGQSGERARIDFARESNLEVGEIKIDSCLASHTVRAAGNETKLLRAAASSLTTPEGTRVALDQHERAQIGRSAVCAVTVRDPEVSRIHAVLMRQDADWVLEDLDSTNGTTLNGAALEQPRRLADGDVIGVGNSCLTFNAA